TTSNVTQQKTITPIISELPRGEIKVIEKEQIETPKEETFESDSTQDNNKVGEGYDVEIFVQKEGKPVSGATVELHSIPRKTTTDNEGIARFQNVEGGNHTVYLAYEGYVGEEKISLNSEDKKATINLTIEVKPYSNWMLIGGIITIIILSSIILLLLFLLKRRKKAKKES
ncbi:MAG TPA: carboxypeptidase-like regulatory domain-containing protein, partial [Candidatus Woesebacteria bacterium]|nr:carboxypeptidase-like regulatory domain-containing protein [Candidatus Woesebacteria bacterium]